MRHGSTRCGGVSRQKVIRGKTFNRVSTTMDISAATTINRRRRAGSVAGSFHPNEGPVGRMATGVVRTRSVYGRRMPPDGTPTTPKPLADVLRSASLAGQVTAVRAWGVSLAQFHIQSGRAHGDAPLENAAVHHLDADGRPATLLGCQPIHGNDPAWDLALAYDSLRAHRAELGHGLRYCLRALLDGYRSAGGPARLTGYLLAELGTERATRWAPQAGCGCG
jgi:hypothetical protein